MDDEKDFAFHQILAFIFITVNNAIMGADFLQIPHSQHAFQSLHVNDPFYSQ